MTSNNNNNNYQNHYSTSSIRSEAWSGSIPIILSLAPTSHASHTMPPSQHALLSRMTYLHVGLRHDILRLYQYAPALTILKGQAGTSIGSTAVLNKPPLAELDGAKVDTVDASNTNATNNTMNDPFRHTDHADIPVCWFEDEVTGTALRWHLFSGVLYDLLKYRHSSKQSNPTHNNNNNNIQIIPWRIRIHFTSYPSSILSLEHYASPPSASKTAHANPMTTHDFHIPKSIPLLKIIQQTFSNSLKQSLFLQHGSSKVAMNMSKFSHVKLWEAIMRNQYHDFWDVSVDLMQMTIPFYSTNHPTATMTHDTTNNDDTIDNDIKVPTDDDKMLIHIPVRLLMNGKPYIQRPCKLQSIQDEFLDYKHQHPSNAPSSANSYFTLGRLLSNWLPSHVTTSTVTNTTTGTESIEYQFPTTPGNHQSCVQWDVQGIRPPLSTPVVDLWLALSHPDHFLYITVSTLA